ncbi:uncharacterized protein LOC114127760 [Aphis gossypii]|uniref:uncharacterized protein LOC114127760 n=1 Tax=Aphis gossypii TaxID=80765 RepID=UPI00215914BC|nr:uncharacterized protein LOC114127760 [Aphis gossypii]
MDPSRGPDVDVDAVVTYLNVLRETLKYVQRIVGTEAMEEFIPPQWVNSRYARDPVLRSNIVVCHTTASGSTFTSTDCSTIISQLNDLADSLLYFEIPSFLNT